jgi:TIR domain/Effector-associated domain 2
LADNNTHSGRRRRTWIAPAAIALILFLGGLASNLVANFIQSSIEPYRLWVWLFCAVAGIISVAVAIRESRKTDDPSGHPHEDVSDSQAAAVANLKDEVNTAKSQQPSMANQHEPPLPSKFKLVAALLGCGCMKDAESRNQVVAQLPDEIGQKIQRFTVARQDVVNIVNTCLQFDDGLEKLLEVIEFFEGDSLAWREVRRVSDEMNNAAHARPVAAAMPRTPDPGKPTVGAAAPSISTVASGNKYDVFLSHNSQDKLAVEKLAVRLEDEAGLKPFLDKWHLVPGEPWQEALEVALDASATCAVCLGPNGIGPWENEELRSALDERVRDKTLRVIPVLLPGANPKDPQTLPRFLRRLTWVDFRGGVESEEAFRLLLAGIRGQAPGRGGN